MKAAVIVRCSGSLLRSRTWSRAATGMAEPMSRPSTLPTNGARSRSTSGGAPSSVMPSFCSPMQAGPRSRTSAGLMPISPASAIASMDSVSVMAGPGDQQLAVDAAGHEEVERAGADPDRHPQHDRAAAQVQPADAIDGALHLPGRPGRPQRVVGAVEHEEQRVAAPLEQAGAPVVGLVEERREHAVERVAHELGADLALAGEALGQGREARDVDEDEGGLDLAMELRSGPPAASRRRVAARTAAGTRSPPGRRPDGGHDLPQGLWAPS